MMSQIKVVMDLDSQYGKSFRDVLALELCKSQLRLASLLNLPRSRVLAGKSAVWVENCKATMHTFVVYT